MQFAYKKPINPFVDNRRKNNSDMNNNSVMMRTKLNKVCSKSVVSQETSIPITSPIRQLCLIFQKLKDPYQYLALSKAIVSNMCNNL